jgi:hypothetical protein
LDVILQDRLGWSVNNVPILIIIACPWLIAMYRRYRSLRRRRAQRPLLLWD